jgi:hypothetical protein
MIRFTQYLQPDGRPQSIEIERPAAVEKLAEAIIAVGVRLEAEVLGTGKVSLTAELDDEEGETETLAIEVVSNGPTVVAAVDRLIRSAHERLAAR